MSTSESQGAAALPPNVMIFTPKKAEFAQSLLGGTIFTRLTVTEQTEPAKLSAALKTGNISDDFCLTHRNVVLIFDNDTDTHHEHFRLVCLALKEADIGLSVAGCIFDTAEVLKAGFQLDTLSSGSVLVIDLMGGDDDDDSEDEEASLAALLNGESGGTIS
ncbi:hypothetical protein CTRI78_v011230 [Colletotrichum trifolii]|uniref:Uncharacterized protein n=1 Tax=Colletotrichum trifolii TaxID=5466 RepID=A0A4R8QG72_COLTR|nr:hypothetical protein CTRI78_v011230 [Colletotrichum trifolii]